MEAVTAMTKNYLQDRRAMLILGVILGLLLGLIIGWGLWPVQWYNATPAELRTDLQQDYLRMTIDSYYRNGNTNLAMQRYNNLGEYAASTYGYLLTDPGYLSPQDVQGFGAMVQSVTGQPIQVPPPGTTTEGSSSTSSQLIVFASLAVILVLLGVAGWFVYRLFRKSAIPPTPVTQAAEISRQTERTDFQSMGLAQPITQTMTTYVLGDDLYDESFSIDTAGGEFLGEYGVGVSETVGVGEPKKVAALEVWLFDKNDIKTATKVLMSEHAYNDPNIRARLEPKGELIVVKPREEVLLETKTLQLLATVVDMEYGAGAAPQKSYFERITLELAVWPRSA
jgi:hypothetical protein